MAAQRIRRWMEQVPGLDRARDTIVDLYRRANEGVAAASLAARNARLMSDLRELEEAYLDYRAHFDLAPGGLLILDVNGRLREANVEAEALLGRPREALVGRPLSELVALDDRRGLRAALARALERDAPTPWSVRLLRHPDGEEIEADLRLSPAPDERGRPAGLRCLVAASRSALRSPRLPAERLMQAAALVTRELELARVIDGAVEHLPSAVGAASAVLLLASADGAALELGAHRDLPPELIGKLGALPFDAPCLLARAARDRRVEAVRDRVVLDSAFTLTREILLRCGAHAMVAAPLVLDGHLLGVLGLIWTDALPLLPSELDALGAAGDIVAASIANARAFAGERSVRVRLGDVGRTTLAIQAEHELGGVLRAVVEQAQSVSRADFVALGLERDLEPPALRWVTAGLDGAAAAGPPGNGARRVPFEGDFVTVPLRYGGKSFGSLYLGKKVGPFPLDEIEALELLAQHAALSVEHARVHARLRHELEERSRAEASLEESVRHFRLALDNSPVVVFDQDRDLRYTFLYNTRLGFRPEEAAGRTDFDICAPADAERLVALKRRVLESGVGARTELQMERDGRVVSYQLTVEPLFGPDGAVQGVSGVAVDITERKRAELERECLVRQLDAERSWLRTVIDRSPVGILLIEGSDGRRIIANRRAEELAGQSLDREGGVAQYLGRIVRADGRPLPLDDHLVGRILEGGGLYREELALHRPDGRDVPLLASAAPIHDPAGQVLGAVMLFEDITPLKQLERLREEWTSVVAHDLRQPVNSINISAAVLKRHADDATIRTCAEHIGANVRRLGRMISDLQDMSLLEARRLRIDRAPTDLRALVAAVIERLAADTAGHPVRLGVADDVPLVSADPGRLEQVLANLLANAAKYGYPDTEIEVAVSRTAQGVEVAVSNRGEGLAVDELDQVFERFRRARRAEASRTTGLGLGLYIAKGLVEAHGGHIWAESTPRERTTFRFTLPG